MQGEEGLVRFLARLALDCCEDDLEGVGRGKGYGGSESGGQRESTVLLASRINNRIVNPNTYFSLAPPPTPAPFS